MFYHQNFIDVHKNKQDWLVENAPEQLGTKVILNNIRKQAKGFEPCSLEDGEKFKYRILQDNGEGIDQEDLPYVFERFYRADKTRGANAGKMGLGLAICKALVNAMGGEIRAFSAGKGQGTSIEIQFDSIQV